VFSGYFLETCRMINDKTLKSQKILHNQIFSQTMMENLINDLLDLAKLENTSFKFDHKYFNLT
jgi:signal transduction histidine kinase